MLVITHISYFFNRIVWLMESKDFEISSRQAPVMAPSLHSQASFCWVSSQISKLIHWNQTMRFQKINNLITHKRFYRLCNLTDDRYWTIIISVINVAIILIDRRHPGVLSILPRYTRLRDLFITFANDIGIYGVIISIKRGPYPIYHYWIY